MFPFSHPLSFVVGHGARGLDELLSAGWISYRGQVKGRKQLACYMIRNPFALEKVTYDGKTGMVIYRSKFHASLKRTPTPARR